MVNVFGNNIISAFTNGVAVKSIYANGELVWPTNSVYILWDSSFYYGEFTINGNSYKYSNYYPSNYFSSPDFSGTITSSAFMFAPISYIETNATYIDQDAFLECSSLTSISLPVCGYVGSWAFNTCSLLTSISLPECEYIGDGAFGGCYSLTNVSLPKCEYIGAYAFRTCSLLTSIDLPVCSYIGNNAFQTCSSLSQVSLPMCEYVGSSAFLSCFSLTSIDLPVCSYIDIEAFEECYSLTNVSLPKCEYIGDAAFYSCSSLRSISLPECKYIGSFAFLECSSLSQVSLPVCGQIDSHAFDDCVSLSLLVLKSNSVVRIDSSYHTFKNTPFSRCSGSILVPVELLNDYLTAPGWSSLSCVIHYIPIYTYINWTPTNLSGSFKMEGNTYNLKDYGGSFIWSNGIIDNYAFSNTSIQTIETNAFSIGYLAFGNCSSLSQVSLPVCTSIDVNAFGITQISYVYLPECIDFTGFANCHSLSFVSAPKCLYIHRNALWNDENITRIEFPECLSVEDGIWDSEDYRGANGGAFGTCDNLNIADLPKCEYLGAGAFAYCSNLTDVNLPVCSYVGSGAFQGCWNLPEIDLPECEYLASYAFRRKENGYITSASMKLSYINLPKCSYIGSNCFKECSSLSRITLGYSGVCVLQSTDVFYKTPISSILVPASLVDAYKADSVWSYFSNRIFPIP